MEGPKITKHDNYYYLTVAEGGTAGPATSHMIISAPSKSPPVPWENSPYNPIVRPNSSSEKWWSKGHGTVIEDAKGNSVGNCSPLLSTPSDHSYTAEVEIFTEGNTTGGLVLFYNNSAFSGILANSANILANINGWQFPTEKSVIKNHVFLGLKNIKSTVDMYFSIDGHKWVKIENSLEISGFNHNTFGGFLGIGIGLCFMGEGNVKFKNFKYEQEHV